MKNLDVKQGEFATFLKDLEQSFHISDADSQEAYTFDRILWLYAGRFGKDSEELLRLYSECWIRYRIKSEAIDTSLFEDGLSCVDWLIAELSTLREAPVPGMDRVTSFVFKRGPSTLKAVVFCPNRGVAFIEGMARAVGEAYGEHIELKQKALGANSCEMEIVCWDAATLPKSS